MHRTRLRWSRTPSANEQPPFATTSGATERGTEHATRHGAPARNVKSVRDTTMTWTDRRLDRRLMTMALAGASRLLVGCAVFDGAAPENVFSFSVRVGSDDHAPIAEADVAL